MAPDYESKNMEVMGKNQFLENLQNIINISKIPKKEPTGIIMISIEAEKIHEDIKKDILTEMSYFDIVARYNNKFVGARAQAEDNFYHYADILNTHIKEIIALYQTEKHPIEFKIVKDVVKSDADAKAILEELEKRI